MGENMEREQGPLQDRLVSVRVAAQRLGVSMKTIHRYLAKGQLTRVKIGTRTFVDSSDFANVNMLVSDRLPKDSQRQNHYRETDRRDTVTLARERYENLLIELGELRKQNEILLAERSKMEDRLERLAEREKELDQALSRARVGEGRKSERDRELNAARERIRRLEEELSRIQAQKQWWQR